MSRCLPLAAIVLAFAGGVSAQAPNGHLVHGPGPWTPIVEPAVAGLDADELLEMLASDDWGVRERANAELRVRHIEGSVNLGELVYRDDLTGEQHARIVGLLRDDFIAQPRAALGITFSDGARDVGVAINDTVPTFPCSRVLRAGDVIVELGGLRLEGGSIRERQDRARAMIQTHLPGEKIDVAFVRQDQEIKAPIVLGSYGDLNNRGRELDPYLWSERCWTARARRLGLDHPASGPTTAPANGPSTIAVDLPRAAVIDTPVAGVDRVAANANRPRTPMVTGEAALRRWRWFAAGGVGSNHELIDGVLGATSAISSRILSVRACESQLARGGQSPEQLAILRGIVERDREQIRGMAAERARRIDELRALNSEPRADAQ